MAKSEKIFSDSPKLKSIFCPVFADELSVWLFVSHILKIWKNIDTPILSQTYEKKQKVALYNTIKSSIYIVFFIISKKFSLLPYLILIPFGKAL